MSRTRHHLAKGKPFKGPEWMRYRGCPSGRNCTVCGKDAKREQLKQQHQAALTEGRLEAGGLDG